MTPHPELGPLHTALSDLEAGRLAVDPFCSAWRRALADLGSRVPGPLAEAAEALLMRMESARWFSGEACGFSSRDLAAALRDWLRHLQAALDTPSVS